jgi:allantoinase
MPADRDYVLPHLRQGMDHDHYDWSPLNARRPVLAWPGGARVAVCVVVSLEHMEWSRPAGAYQVPNLAGGYGQGPFPDVTAWSHREYGHRVGIFRVLDALDAHGVEPTIAMDALTAEHYPFLVRHCRGRGDEIIGHGVSVNRMITSRMSEDEERQYIRGAIDSLTRAFGAPPRGWLGPEYGESTRTPALLAEAGIQYVCDWVNDEQPYALRVPRGELYALPVSLPLDDVHALWDRRVDVDRYGRMIEETFDVLHRDGERGGRLLVLRLHPWLIGQPFRIGVLETALRHIVSREGVASSAPGNPGRSSGSPGRTQGSTGRATVTPSIRPNALASSGERNLSRARADLIASSGCPVCLTYSSFMRVLRCRISRAWMSMSVARPWAPPDGWCTMMREFGSA